MQEKRSIQLDFLRGIAVLLVLGRHVPDIPGDPDPVLAIFRIGQRAGWAGVELFFVLSGFLVSGLLFSEWKTHREIRPSRFFIRRGLKIYPAFYLMLLFSVTLIFRNVPWQRTLTEALFVQNYFMGVSNIWNHTWTLAIEEHFYLALGCLLWCLARRRTSDPFRPMVLIFVLIGPGSALARTVGFMSGIPAGHLFLQSHFRMDALFFGALLSYLHQFHRQPFEGWVVKNRSRLLIAGLLLVSPVLFRDLEYDLFLSTIGLSFVHAGFGAILLFFLYREPRPRSVLGPAVAALSKLGFYSYSIYLWHVPWEMVSLAVCRHSLGWNLSFYGATAVYLTGALCAGVLMAKIIELPFLALRDRFFPSRTAPVQ